MEKMVDAIKEGEIIRISEWRAREEDLFILRRIGEEVSVAQPTSQLREAERAKPAQGRISEWKIPKPYYKNNNVLRDLLDNFHWEIVKGRKNKNLSRKQLASAIGASEDDLRVIEMGQLPRDDFVFVNKIERALGINLRKDRTKTEVNLAELQRRGEQKAKEASEKSSEGAGMSEEKKGEKARGNDSGLLGTDIEIIE